MKPMCKLPPQLISNPLTNQASSLLSSQHNLTTMGEMAVATLILIQILTASFFYVHVPRAPLSRSDCDVLNDDGNSLFLTPFNNVTAFFVNSSLNLAMLSILGGDSVTVSFGSSAFFFPFL